MTNNTKTEMLIRTYYDAMNSDQLESVWPFYDDNIVYEDVALGHVFNGLEELKQFYIHYMSALQVKNSIESLVTTEDSFSIGFCMEGRHIADLPDLPATNKPFKVRGATIGSIRDGKIIENRDYWNLAELMGQLGISVW